MNPIPVLILHSTAVEHRPQFFEFGFASVAKTAAGMLYAAHPAVNTSVFAFAVMASLTIAFAACIMSTELNLQLQLSVLKQTGDTSLRPQSVNWLAPLAFVTALLICLI